MKQKKSKLVVTLIIIVIIIIMLVLSGIICLTTDLFKSNKDLWLKYAAQIVDDENGFMESSLIQYMTKKNNIPYMNEGNFSINANSKNQNLDNVNKFTVTYKGQVNNSQEKEEANISLNYSDEVKFPINYRKVKNNVGIQTDYLTPKYIVFNSSEENLVNNGEDNKENVQPTSNEYLQIMSKISEDKFSKIDDASGTGYKLELSGDDVKNTLVQFLEKLSSDDVAIDNMNKFLKTIKSSTKLNSQMIEEYITNLTNNVDMENQKFEFVTYKKLGKITKFILATNECNIEIQKATESKDKIEYIITANLMYNGESLKLNLILSYDKLSSDELAKERYTLSVENAENTYTYNIENNVKFVQNITIQDMNKENSLILSEYEDTAVDDFLNQVKQRLKEVNAEQMEQLGIAENDNPIGYLLPQLGNYEDLIKTIKGTKISEEDIQTFNQKFEVYQSTNLQGVTVKGLLTTINLNNEGQDSKRKITEIHFNGEEYEASSQNVAFIKEDVKLDGYYRVEFEKNQETGIIYRVVINPK